MKKKLISLIGISAVAATLAIGGLNVFAENDNKQEPKQIQKRGEMPGMGMGPVMKFNNANDNAINPYTKLVKDGVISQETADKIAAYMKEKGTALEAELKAFKEKVANMTKEDRDAYIKENFPKINPEKPNSLLDEMVSKGVITQADADKIKDATAKARWTSMESNLLEKLNEYVNANIISADTKEKMMHFIKSEIGSNTFPLVRQDIKLKEASGPNFKIGIPFMHGDDMLQKMVDAGVLSSTQKDAIVSYEKSKTEAKMSESIKNKFQVFVDQGIINQDQLNKIVDFHVAQINEMKTKVQELKPDNDGIKDTIVKRADMFEQLVEKGIITSEQANKMKEYQDSLKGKDKELRDGEKAAGKPAREMKFKEN